MAERKNTGEDELVRLRVYRNILETLPVGVFVIDAQGVPLFANDVAVTLLGQGVSPDAAGRLGEVYKAYTLDGAIYPESRMPINKALRGDHSHVDDMIVDNGHEKVHLEVFASPVYDSDGAIQFATAVFRDVTRLHTAEEAASHDPLTGLANRAALETYLRRRIGREDLGVFFLDLDGFKDINDKHGHQVGDSVLKIVASRLGRSTRKREFVFRYGGDEFVVVCEDIVREEALDSIAYRFRDAIRETMHVDGLSFGVDVSVGRIRSSRRDKSVSDLLSRADAEMYERKRNRYRLKGQNR